MQSRAFERLLPQGKHTDGTDFTCPILTLSFVSAATVMKTVLLFLIKAYQWGLSPLFGGHCRFYPSCSAYAAEAIDLHGAAHGTWLAARRLLRCHPWHEGGVDPVPPKVIPR